MDANSSTGLFVSLAVLVGALAYTVRKLSDALSRRNANGKPSEAEKRQEFEKTILDLQSDVRMLRQRVLRLEHRSSPHDNDPSGDLR